MVICRGTTQAYYPMSDKGPDLIRGSRRIRFVRGFVLVNRKESGAVSALRSQPEKSTQDGVLDPEGNRT